MAFSSPFALSQLACCPLNNLESPYPAAASRFPLLRPALRRYRFRSHLTSPKSRLPNPQPETVTPTAVTLNLLDHVRKPLTAALFCLAVALLPIPFLRAPAIAAPAATVAPTKKSGKTSISYTTEHEFSHYTRRLLEEAVSVLLQRIEDVKSNNGEMRSVKEALKQVKMMRMEIQKEVMGNLNAELRVLRAQKAELMLRSGEVVDAATTAQKERDKLLKDGGEDGEVKEKLKSLERRIADADMEYGDIWDSIGDIEDKMARRQTMTLSIAIRELSFIEKESEVLVERFRLEQRNKVERQRDASETVFSK